MNFNATFQPTYIRNDAPISTHDGALAAIVAQGCCPAHPDVALRRKKAFGRTEIIRFECHWCMNERVSNLQQSQTNTTSVTTSTPTSGIVDTYTPINDETFLPHGPFDMGVYPVPVVNVQGFPDAFDTEGRCIHHNEIQLIKPTWFESDEMTVLRTECPKCTKTWQEESDRILQIESSF